MRSLSQIQATASLGRADRLGPAAGQHSHQVTRYAHQKANPEIPAAEPVPATGINYPPLIDTACGYPRAVNNFAVQALFSAHAEGKPIVDETSAHTNTLVGAHERTKAAPASGEHPCEWP